MAEIGHFEAGQQGSLRWFGSANILESCRPGSDAKHVLPVVA
jgi:hypothetical protein